MMLIAESALLTISAEEVVIFQRNMQVSLSSKSGNGAGAAGRPAVRSGALPRSRLLSFLINMILKIILNRLMSYFWLFPIRNNELN